MPNKLGRRLLTDIDYYQGFSSPQVDALYNGQNNGLINKFDRVLTNTYPLEVLGHRVSFGLQINTKEWGLNNLFNRYNNGDYLLLSDFDRLQEYCDKGVNQEYEPDMQFESRTLTNIPELKALVKAIGEGLIVSDYLRAVEKAFEYYVTGCTMVEDDWKLLQGYGAHQLSEHVFDSSPPPVPDKTVVTNDNGGSQSHTGTRFDLLPYSALDIISQVLYSGAIKYGDNNWKRLPVSDHLNHALRHLLRFGLTGDTEDLSHGVCRAIFALTIHIEGVHTDDTN